MSKKARYWTIGIVAALVIFLAIWAVAVNNNSASNSPSSSSDMGAGHNSHTPSASDSFNLSSYLKEQDTIMADMMTAMENIEKSGNASIDFLNGMIPHHESAVDMAESYLKNGGTNEKLQEIANAIIETQTKEIEEMKSMILTLQETGQTDEQQEAAYLTEYNKMFQNHHAGHGSMSTPKSVDVAFGEGMIEHHQMAVDMAKAILDHTDVEEVKQFAQTVIDTQDQEIKDMQTILNDLAEAPQSDR